MDVRFYEYIYIVFFWYIYSTVSELHLKMLYWLSGKNISCLNSCLPNPGCLKASHFPFFPHWPHPTLSETWHLSAPFLLQQALMLEGKSPIPVHTCQWTFTMSLFFSILYFFLILADFLWKKTPIPFWRFYPSKNLETQDDEEAEKSSTNPGPKAWKKCGRENFGEGFSHQFQGRRGNLFLCVCYIMLYRHIYIFILMQWYCNS